MIGLLFASFGVTLLVLSIPMGAMSDRLGRKGPMIVGLALLAAATLAFAYTRVACDAVRRAASAGSRRRHDVDRRLRAHRRSLRPGGARPRDGACDGGQQPRHHHRPRARRMAVRNRGHPAAVPLRGGHGGRRSGGVRARRAAHPRLRHVCADARACWRTGRSPSACSS